MAEYVVISCQRGNLKEDCLMVHKDKPRWQQGRLNLPGGKIEEGETPQDAATRELLEESGYEPIIPIRVMGTIHDGPDLIHCCKAVVDFTKEPTPRPEETQKIEWINWHTLRIDERLIPNLRIIIPLIQAGVSGWHIGDTYRSNNSPLHTISLAIPTLHKEAQN